MSNKIKATIKTLVLSVALTVVNAITSLILQRLIIEVNGSSVNGLISTLTQFVSLFSIVEGGFTTAAIVATYNPIAENDYNKLNAILFNTKRTFKKIGVIIFIGAIVFGTIYVRFIDSPIEYGVILIILIECSIASTISVSVVSIYSVLLQGNNKEYIVSAFTMGSRIITGALAAVLICCRMNIGIYYVSQVLYPLLTAFFLYCYVRNKYPYITFRGKTNDVAIEGTKDVFLQKIANTIFTSTDLLVISVFIDLASASVYNVYFQIFKMIQILLNSLTQAPFNSFGQILHSENKRNIGDWFHFYQTLVLVTSTAVLTTSSIMILPFIRLYVEHVDNVQYISSILVLMFFSQFYAQINNRPYGTILNAAGLFKKQNKQCIIAAFVNIFISIAFIDQLGIVSVILGSVIATCIILIANMYQVFKNLVFSGVKLSILKMIINYFMGVIIVIEALTYVEELVFQSYVTWFICSIFVFVVMEVVFIVINLILDKDVIIKSIVFCKKRLSKNI